MTEKEVEGLQLALQLRAKGLIRTTQPPFVESREKEIKGLLDRGVFEIVNIGDVPTGTRIFNSRFVDDIKGKDTDTPYEKSRLVIQAHNDIEKKKVLTQSPTIQRSSQRLILSLAMVKNEMTLNTRDISQAYVQSNTNLNRVFYARPPKELKLEGVVLQVLKPLYGVPESGTHWFRTYHNHHTANLGLVQSTYDPCLLYGPNAVVGLQTDDTLFLADTSYIRKEDDELKRAGYTAKPITTLVLGHDVTFNGGNISLQSDGSIKLTQPRQCQNICLINTSATDTNIRTQYIKERARGAYIASMCQPEAAFKLSFAAQISEPTKDDVAYLNKVLKWQQQHATRGLTFIRLLPEELKLMVFVDASFANNKDLSSQIGFVIVMATETREENTIQIQGNIIHWSSTKCKRITRSVLASELYAMVAGFDMGSAISSTVKGILLAIENHADMPLIICTDSYSLYDCMIKLGTTAEKRLMIDIMGLRQSYERREISEVRWIDGECNPADAMTKDQPGQALRTLIDTNRLQLTTKGWVERKGSGDWVE